MWDEIAAVAWLDPAIITKQQELYVNVDIDHGASYGQTIFVEPSGEPAPGQPPWPARCRPGGTSPPCSGTSTRNGSTMPLPN